MKLQQLNKELDATKKDYEELCKKFEAEQTNMATIIVERNAVTLKLNGITSILRDHSINLNTTDNLSADITALELQRDTALANY